jgi:hypothetical protein
MVEPEKDRVLSADMFPFLIKRRVQDFLKIDPTSKKPYLGFRPVGINWDLSAGRVNFQGQEYDTITYDGYTPYEHISATWYKTDLKTVFGKLLPEEIPLVRYSIDRRFGEDRLILEAVDYVKGTIFSARRNGEILSNPNFDELELIAAAYELV